MFWQFNIILGRIITCFTFHIFLYTVPLKKSFVFRPPIRCNAGPYIFPISTLHNLSSNLFIFWKFHLTKILQQEKQNETLLPTLSLKFSSFILICTRSSPKKLLSEENFMKYENNSSTRKYYTCTICKNEWNNKTWKWEKPGPTTSMHSTYILDPTYAISNINITNGAV